MNIKQGDNMKRTRVVVGVALLALVCGAALGSNMGFKLNYGVVTALKALLSPSGFDAEGQCRGAGVANCTCRHKETLGSKTRLQDKWAPGCGVILSQAQRSDMGKDKDK